VGDTICNAGGHELQSRQLVGFGVANWGKLASRTSRIPAVYWLGARFSDLRLLGVFLVQRHPIECIQNCHHGCVDGIR